MKVSNLQAVLLVLFLGSCVQVLRAQTFPQQSLVATYESGRSSDADGKAKDLVAKYPDDPRAYFWLALAEPGSKESRQGIEKIRLIPSAKAWTLLAKATTNTMYATTYIDQALEAAPDDADVLQAATVALVEINRYNGETLGVQRLLEKHRDGFSKSADLLVTEAHADLFVRPETATKDFQNHAMADLDQALVLNPHNENAIVLKVQQLRRTDAVKAYAFIQKVAPSFPDSYRVQTELWITALNQKDAKALQGQIQRDITAMLQRKLPKMSELRAISDAVSAIPDMRAAVIETLIKADPGTAQADLMLVQQALTDPPVGTPEQDVADKIAALETYLARPNHPDSDTLKFARASLEGLMSGQENPDLAKLYIAVENNSGFSRGIRVLAKKKYRLPDLERLALLELDDRWDMLHSRLDTMRDLNGFVDFVIGDYVHFSETSLGLIYLEEGKLELAEKTLTQARELHDNDSVTTVYLAQVYQAKGDFTKAQSLMLEALNESYYGRPSNPAIEALPELYKAEHNGTDGLDAFMKPIIEKAREQRKQAVLKAKQFPAAALPDFHFVDLKGKPVSLADYNGKIVVMNFWATWCGPCRKEFLDYQKLSAMYKDDPRVAIVAVSIDDADTPSSSISSYIDKNQFTFPVFRGAEFAKENHISTIPFTWFVDESGKIIFSKLGNSPDLVEEFGWRLDVIEHPPRS
jgi:thiol-disulfide isomerase/thioredoxin